MNNLSCNSLYGFNYKWSYIKYQISLKEWKTMSPKQQIITQIKREINIQEKP